MAQPKLNLAKYSGSFCLRRKRQTRLRMGDGALGRDSPLELFLRVITVSLETMKIADGLPTLDGLSK